jgi:molybdopterin/thiamine biosynthesis adenylyltransferase
LSDNFAPQSPLSGRTVLVAGVGNVGSSLPALLARAGATTIRLVDRDVVETKNLAAQDYRPEDVGRFKSDVQAERLRAQFPQLTVESYPVDLEDLPLGVAAVDLILGGLDSRRARQVLVGEIGWPLGVPVVDGGVGDPLLGRVQVFVPGDTACLECTWGAADYRLAAAEYPCVPGASASAAPTGAPAFLGAFTASVMVSEALRLLAPHPPAPSPTQGRGGDEKKESYEIPFDLDYHQLRRFSLRRAARCRHDHIITRETIAAGESVGDVLGAIEKRFGTRGVSLSARRGIGRFLNFESLSQRRQEPLANLGLTRGDRVRATCGGESAWMCF